MLKAVLTALHRRRCLNELQEHIRALKYYNGFQCEDIKKKCNTLAKQCHREGVPVEKINEILIKGGLRLKEERK